MSIDLKLLAKRAYYRFSPAELPATTKLTLGCVLHTERIYDATCFETLLAFCEDYRSKTGKRVICTMMSGVNARVEAGCRRNAVSREAYADRARRLAEIAIVGYHGHFWNDLEAFRANEARQTSDVAHSEELELRANNFVAESLRAQVSADLQWFAESKISHNGLYAGGWWFTNEHLIAQLIENGFRFDFSFSKSPYFRNQYSQMIMANNNVRTGEPFAFVHQGRELVCIQNFVGCSLAIPQDFTRNLAKLMDGRTELLGVANAHDYDLDRAHAMGVFEYLKDEVHARFFDVSDLQVGAGDLKRILKFPLERCASS